MEGIRGSFFKKLPQITDKAHLKQETGFVFY